MVAEGEYEKAEGILEEFLKMLEVEEIDPWIVEQVQRRAREIRDEKGAARPLFHDPALQRKLIIRCVYHAARKSVTAKKITGYLDRASTFGRECDKHIPLVGGGEDGEGEESNREETKTGE